MAKEYTVKVFGKKTKYRKVNGKFFRVKKDGTLAKDAATGLVLANLKNAAGSSIVSSPDKLLATVRSAVNKKRGSGQMSRGTKKAMASPTKDDGGKAKMDFKKDIDKAINKSKKSTALNIIKKDASNTKTDRKISTSTTKTQKKNGKNVELPVLKKKQDKKNGTTTKPLQATKIKNVKTTKTKALQNQPKNGNGNGSKTKARKPESRLDAKGNYKGTNIKPTKLQLERLKKRGLA
jgi:hypothetical protein